ncbi:MAG: hypothetical protein M1840_002030 [Geoglossum simile]|nr:MAG: hypothetical protein M1840_002030 [Geoglossum simile]
MPNSSTAPISETSLEPQTHYRFNSQQTQRFYQALTAHWLSIECLRLVEICNYRTQTLNIQHYETLHNMWANNDERTLRESCDVLEVYDFVQGYLVRKIFADVTEISQWVHGEEQGIVIDERPEDNWDYFVKTARLHLRPFDIIELFLMGPWRTNMNSLSYPPDKVAYFRHRGLFDTGGLIDIQDTGNSPDPWFSVFHLETDVGLKLMATDKGLTNVWAYFRNKWVMQGIRKELWLAESDEDIAGWIRKFGEGRNYSSTNKTSPHISGKSLCREYVSPNALGPSN